MTEENKIVELRKALRAAIADYIYSEGCGCCGNRDEHEASKERISKLLNVKKYSDKSGYDFSKYQTKK